MEVPHASFSDEPLVRTETLDSKILDVAVDGLRLGVSQIEASFYVPRTFCHGTAEAPSGGAVLFPVSVGREPVVKDLIRDCNLAWRGLRRRPSFFLLVVTTLALAIGVNVSIFSLVQALLLRPLPFPEGDRLVRIVAFKGVEATHLSQREIEDIQRDGRVFQGLAGYYHSQYNVTGDGPPEAAATAIGTHQLFSVVGARFALGGPFSAAEDFRRQYRVVLGHGFWQRRFGSDPGIVGGSVVLDGGTYVVDGVLAAGETFPPGVDLFRQVTEYHGLDGRRHSVIARLHPEATLQQAQQELEAFSRSWQEQFQESHRGLRFEAVPLRDSWVGPVRPYLLLLSAGVAFVLLIAVVNVVNLQLSRSGERRHELTLRAALGASRLRLVRLLLIESLLQAAFGGALGVVFAAGWLHVLRGMTGADLPQWMGLRLDWGVLSVAGALVLVTGIAAGLLPALKGSRAGGAEGLRSRSPGSAAAGAGRLRRALVVTQVSLALALLLGAGLMIRSASALDGQDLGFDADGLFTLRVDPPYWSYHEVEALTPLYRNLVRELQGIPGVRGVAANQNLPLGGLDGNTKRLITLEGQSQRDQEGNPFVHLQSVNPSYFGVMGIPLLQGRWFEEEDGLQAPPVAVVSRSLAERLWGVENSVGRRLKLGPPAGEGDWIEVVGVAGDVRSARRVGAPSPDFYVSHFQHLTGDTFFALRTSLSGSELLQAVQAAVARVDGDLPIFDAAPMVVRVADQEWQRRVTGTLFQVFGLLALALAAVGIYGVMSLAVTSRRREMGIRVALGAVPGTLFTGVLREGAVLFLWGSAFGLAFYLPVTRLISSLLFGVAVTDATTVVGAFGLLLAVAILASGIPARRASRLDPLVALRGES